MGEKMEFGWIAFLAVFTGVLTRTCVPYLVKLKNNPRLKWENKYLISALAGFVLSLITTLLILPTIDLTVGFVPIFGMAYCLHDLSREAQKLLGFG